MPDLLLELFSEEIPARMQKRAAEDLRKLVTDGLVEQGLTYEGAKAFYTPRRIALAVHGLTARSADIREDRKGPRTDAPEKAIQGFLRGAGLSSIEEAEIRSDPKKGDFYVAVIEKPGREASDIIQEIVPEAIRKFPWPKSMRWGAASAEPGSLRWVRPLRSILCTFGPETEDPDVIDFEVHGIRSGNVTYGHRFHAPEAITIKRLDDYQAKLEAANVILDPERRADVILHDAKDLAFARGLELVEDAGLLAEVAGLVEWPVVLMGTFDEAFLDIPPEVIQLTIRENQKCFVLKDAKTGDLSNTFILVANIAAKDGGVEIVKGNERVVRARLSDAKFFWESDLAVSLDARAEKLQIVTFHEKLGTQLQRVRRIEDLAARFALASGADEGLTRRAAALCKADLMTEMVYEFPELQGLMGRYYAQAAAEDPAVALALEDHYRPEGPSDNVPGHPVGLAVALADKVDTLAGFWAIGETPTGSKDPYALRRAMLGVIRIILENGLRVRLSYFIMYAFMNISLDTLVGGNVVGLKMVRKLEEDGFLEPGTSEKAYERLTSDEIVAIESEKSYAQFASILDDLLASFHGRLKVYLRDKGARHDLIDAVITPDADDLFIVVKRIEALGDFLSTDDGINLLAGYKRAANILAAEQKKGTPIADEVDPDLLQEPAEKAFAEAVLAAEKHAADAIIREDFHAAMQALAGLRAPVDTFFDKILVNVEDAALRANRLALLTKITNAIHPVADFNCIEG